MSLLAQIPGWIPFVGSAVGGGGIGAGVRPLLEYWKGQRKQTDEVAMGLVEKLQARIDRLEQAQSAERELCDTKLQVLRQQLANVRGDFEALLLAIEIAPDKAAEVVARLKERRSPPAKTDAEA